VKIFPLSELILLPLAPTIARTIADYLQSISQQPYINTLLKKGDYVVTESPQDLSWQWQFQKSIRQIPTSQYQYVSTIAHQLAPKSLLNPAEICQSLHPPIPVQSPIDRSACLELYYWYDEASYIYFQLTPTAISTWLNYIHYLPIVPSAATLETLPLADCNSQSTDVRNRNAAARTSNSSIDLAIYAHARCCSLLKLAEAEKLVTITGNWQITTPDCLLNVFQLNNRPTAASKCIFEHPVENRLIHALMEVLDGIYGDNWQLESLQSESNGQISSKSFNGHKKSPNWTKLTIDLAQSWLEFYRHCQIFGDVKHQNSRLAIARCVLTAISRRYLQVLLENNLGMKAILEL
jgi:hypothetical protein